MRISDLDGQESLFGLDMEFGKMSPVLSAADETPSLGKSSGVRTSERSSKPSSKLKKHTFMLLDLRAGGGNLLGAYWENDPPWLGPSGTLDTSECPKGVVESSLWQILEATAPSKYSLSKTACLGILRRAKKRDKPLPPELYDALMLQSGRIAPMALFNRKLTAFAANQRDEVRDLHGIAGALSAQPGMKQQTFVTQESLLCLNDQGGNRMDITVEATATLRACMSGHPPLVSQTDCHNGMNDSQNLEPTQNITASTPTGADGGGDGQAGQGYPSVFAAGFSAGAGASAGGIGYSKSVAPTLKGCASGSMMPSVLCLNDQGGRSMDCTEGVSGTLRAQEHGHQPLVFDNHGQGSRYKGPVGVSQTVSASFGMGGNNTPLVETEPPVYCIAGNAIDRKPENGGNGLGFQRDISYTLTCVDKHAVYDAQASACQPYQAEIGALCRGDEKGIGNQYVSQNKCIVERKNLIRRLMPVECERLQGFPDNWTELPKSVDSPRYKSLGNSVAVPCVEYLLQGVALALRSNLDFSWLRVDLIYESNEE